MADIKVYSAPGCLYCVFAKDFLKENNISFKEIDVSKDLTAAQDMVKETGQMSVPVIKINNKFIIGFNKEELKKELNL